jgi:methionine-rich copper-binding protein CopC
MMRPTPHTNELPPRRGTRSAVVAGLGTAVVIGAVLGAPAAAYAHNYLVGSTPTAGETLTVLPETFEIVTNEALLASAGLGGFALEVRDADGLFYGDGCVVVDGPTMSTAAALGDAGDYTIIWQAVSGDGHTVSDELEFTWEPTDAATPAATGSETAPVCAAETDEGTAPAEEDDGDAATPGAATTTSDDSDVVWIGGTASLIAVVVGITLWLTRRKKKD